MTIQHKKDDITMNVLKYHSGMTEKNRMASFDLCYSYFKVHQLNLASENIEMSCLQLWCYLASWGMLRNSDLILNTPASFKPLMEYLSTIKESEVWGIDVTTYTEENMRIICEVYDNISSVLSNSIISSSEKFCPSVTLITKIMLGIFGCVPAFDSNFCFAMRTEFGKECRFRCVDKKSLLAVASFYTQNRDDFESIKIKTIGFNGDETPFYYPKAKLVDMYGFAKGVSLAH